LADNGTGFSTLYDGNGLSNQPIDTLFFSAGPGDEEHGLYGRLDVMKDDQFDDRKDAE
jgi:hypothetical protein